MQELILSIGLPACGKTTWAEEFIQRHTSFYNINRDDIRLMLQGRARYGKFTKTREALVSTVQFSTAKHALLAGQDVIISDTNLNPVYRKKWEAFALNFKEKHGVEVQYREKLFTDTPLGVCLERDKMREFPVGSNVITGMFEKYQDDFWPAPKYDHTLPDAYIFDVDGTVAHMHNRRPFQWDKVKEDLPKEDVIRILNTLSIGDDRVHLIGCSGRDGVCEQDTREWLTDNGVPYDAFFIRPPGSNEKDYVIKENIYNNHIKGKYNVLGVFDDRDQVVHLWRHLGLTTFQVNYGDF